MNRRAFVKAAVGAGAAGAGAAVAWTGIRPLVDPREADPGPVRYYAARLVGGPGPRGVPYLPVRVGEDGDFRVRTRVGELDVLQWQRYCGHSAAPGLDHDHRADDRLRYFVTGEDGSATRPWYADREGEPVRPGHFPGDEFGARFTYRSDGQSGPDVLVGVIARLPASDVRLVTHAGPAAGASPMTPHEFDFFRDEFLVRDGDSVFVACSAVCTHFCCIHGWFEESARPIAEPREAWGKVFCSCHSQTCEPREPVVEEFHPEPEDAET